MRKDRWAVITLCTGLVAIAATADAWGAEAIPDQPLLPSGESRTDAAQDEVVQFSSGPSLWTVLLRLVVSLGIVVGLVYGVVYLLRIASRRVGKGGRRDALVRVVDRATLDSKRVVYVIKVVDRLLVVGAGPAEMRLLAEIKDEAAVESVDDVDFSHRVHSLLSRVSS